MNRQSLLLPLAMLGCSTPASVANREPAAALDVPSPVATFSPGSPWRDHTDALWRAVCLAESSGNPRAVGDGGRAVGIAQIWAITVEDCNRIAGRARWTLNDRLDPVASRAMFEVYMTHYVPRGTIEDAARTWNGGPRGRFKATTVGYANKVIRIMEERQ